MFDQLKDLNNLRKQAAELQKQLEAEVFTETAGSVTLTLNGNQELLEVIVAEQADRKTIANDFREAYTRAQKKLKASLASKFQGLI